MFAGMYYYFSICRTLSTACFTQTALPLTTVLFIHLTNTAAVLGPRQLLGLTQSLKDRLASM